MNSRLYDRLAALVSLLLLVSLGLFTYYLAAVTGRNGPTERAPTTEPDYFVEQLALVTVNAVGEPAFRLEADELRHLPDDDSTLFIGPRMISLDPTQPRVVIVAERARLIHEANETHLSGSVVITRAATPTAAELRAETEHAVVLPNESIVRSDQPVRITQGQNLLTGVGMELDNRTRQLRLDSQVRAVWVGDSGVAGPPSPSARPSTPIPAR